MKCSLRSLPVSVGRFGLALLLACSSVSAQSFTPSHPGFKASAPTRYSVTAEEKDILGHLSIVYLDDGQGGTVKTLDISGINVRIHNGSGTTGGAVDGLGNLIVGYNELGNLVGDDRTGSHNIITGQKNSFSSYGGLVAGSSNRVSGPWSSVSGGRESTVSGGYYNTASGDYSSVSGGRFNTASGYISSVSGGRFNTAYGQYSSVSGGQQNTASGWISSVSGGIVNTASGISSSVSGGYTNTASGFSSSVSGGNDRSALGTDNWAAGSLSENN